MLIRQLAGWIGSLLKWIGQLLRWTGQLCLAMDRRPSSEDPTTPEVDQPVVAMDRILSRVDRTTHWADRPALALDRGPFWGGSDNSPGGSASIGLGSGAFVVWIGQLCGRIG